MYSKQNEFFTNGTTAEDQMKIHAVRLESEEIYERDLYREATRRVVFHNCMDECGLDNTKLKYFDSTFYYSMPEEQRCLQSCFNDRVALHLGVKAALNHNLTLNFQDLKAQYQGYEEWNPNAQIMNKVIKMPTEEKISQMANNLLERSKQTRYGKFDF